MTELQEIRVKLVIANALQQYIVSWSDTENLGPLMNEIIDGATHQVKEIVG